MSLGHAADCYCYCWWRRRYVPCHCRALVFPPKSPFLVAPTRVPSLCIDSCWVNEFWSPDAPQPYRWVGYWSAPKVLVDDAVALTLSSSSLVTLAHPLSLLEWNVVNRHVNLDSIRNAPERGRRELVTPLRLGMLQLHWMLMTPLPH